MDLKESLEEPVSSYMTENFVTVRDDETVYHAAIAITKAGASEAVVIKGTSPAGIITEKDILYKVVAPGLRAEIVQTKDIMSSPLESIDENSKVKDAIGTMSRLGIRRLAVTREGQVIGMVTQKAMLSGAGQVPLPELTKPSGINCPYCGASMKSGAELSKHIDQVHLGLGLLEGDSTKW